MARRPTTSNIQPPKPKIIKDEQTGIKHRVSSDVRIAAQNYASISGVLAGFAFTVVILIVQVDGSSTVNSIPTQSKAAIGFLVAFFACIMSCFAFSVIAAEELLTPRANHMALFAGLGFSTATSLLFWSLAIILKAFLTTEVAIVANQIFPIFIFVHPAYVATSILDNIYLFDFRRPRISEFIFVLIPSYLPLIIGLFLRLYGVSLDVQVNGGYFSFMIWSLLISAVISNLLALLFSASSEEYRMKLWVSGLLIGTQSLILALLILSL